MKSSRGGVGAFVDDTRVVIDGVTDADGFEGATLGFGLEQLATDQQRADLVGQALDGLLDD